MKRKTLTKAARVRIFDAAKGLCGLCNLPIKVGELWDAHHGKQLWAGGADDERNLVPVHVECHAVKSAADAPLKAKTDRVRAAHIGAEPERPTGFRPKKQKEEFKDPFPGLPRPGMYRRFR